jgi:hypothetical protein
MMPALFSVTETLISCAANLTAQKSTASLIDPPKRRR